MGGKRKGRRERDGREEEREEGEEKQAENRRDKVKIAKCDGKRFKQ